MKQSFLHREGVVNRNTMSEEYVSKRSSVVRLQLLTQRSMTHNRAEFHKQGHLKPTLYQKNLISQSTK